MLIWEGIHSPLEIYSLLEWFPFANEDKKVNIRGFDTRYISAISYKGDNSYMYDLFVFLHTKFPLKNSLPLKVRIYFKGEQGLHI